ncbi:MAG: hypothetical protein ABIF18_00755 [archaeon]
MEFSECPAKETENKIDDSFFNVEQFKTIIYKLVMGKELDEGDREIIDKIVEKKDEEVYGDEKKECAGCDDHCCCC